MGVSSDLVIYANPCKQRSMLQYARNNEVRMMTADNLVSWAVRHFLVLAP
jgi:hypothetical protein